MLSTGLCTRDRVDTDRRCRRLEDHAVRGDSAARGPPGHRPGAVRSGPDRRRGPDAAVLHDHAAAAPPALVVAAAFRMLDALRLFDLAYVVTGGGPGTATEPVSLYAFIVLMQRLRFGYASALSVTVFLLTVAFALVWLRALGRSLTGARARACDRRPSFWRVAGALLLAGMLFPFYWMFVSSLTPESQLFEAAPLVPPHASLGITAHCSTSAASSCRSATRSSSPG